MKGSRDALFLSRHSPVQLMATSSSTAKDGLPLAAPGHMCVIS